MASGSEAVGRLVNVEVMAERLNVSPSWLYKRVARKAMPFKKMGGLVRFDVDAVLKWVDRGCPDEH